MLNQVLLNAKRIQNNTDWEYYWEWYEGLVNPELKKWDIPPVSVATFIDDPYFLGKKDDTYPMIKKICTEVTEGGYTEGVLVAGLGSGKCLGKGTKILQYNGTKKKVEEMKVGDLVMGDDGTPRTVTGITRGTEELFKLTPEIGWGEELIVNASHILAFRDVLTQKGYFLITAREFSALPEKVQRRLEFCKAVVDYDDMPVLEVDPFIVGSFIARADIPVEDRKVPESISRGSVETRIKFLRGLLLHTAEAREFLFSISIKKLPKKLLTSIRDIVWSLGLQCDIDTDSYMWISGCMKNILTKKELKTLKYNNEALYQPTYSITSLGKGEYFGIEVDENHLYVLGDYTITHNSYTSQILSCYMVHKLLCMEDPHKFYGLAADKEIATINMGVSAAQAKNVVFSGIAAFINESPFFMSYEPDVLKTEVNFIHQKIKMLSGNSKATTPLGLNVICAVLDEASFYLDNDENDVAEEIYNQVQGRIISRFGDDGLCMIISSPRYEQDFTMRKYRESQQIDADGELINPHVFGFLAPTWRVKHKYQKSPKWAMQENLFYFDSHAGTIVNREDIKKEEDIAKLRDTEPHVNKRYWEIPNDFKKPFRNNPEKGRRDLGAVPSMTLEGFFPIPEIIDTMANKDHDNPICGDGTYEFPYPRKVPHYIHVDLALNKKKGTKRGDRAGFAVCHIESFFRDPESGDILPKIYVDLVEAIEADETGEVQFSKVRQKIYDLQDFGFVIGRVTLDGFQSVDTLQILKSRGIRAEFLSVDRSLEPYNTLKQLINMKRLDVYKYKILEDELKHLELLQGTKVDHPPGWSKDVSDALAGACYSAIMDTVRSGGMV